MLDNILTKEDLRKALENPNTEIHKKDYKLTYETFSLSKRIMELFLYKITGTFHFMFHGQMMLVYWKRFFSEDRYFFRSEQLYPDYFSKKPKQSYQEWSFFNPRLDLKKILAEDNREKFDNNLEKIAQYIYDENFKEIFRIKEEPKKKVRNK
jgi:hypothetical protein